MSRGWVLNPPPIHWIPRGVVKKRVVHTLLECFLVTGRNEVVAKVIFLHLFVILFKGGTVVVSHKALRQTPPPRTRHPPPPEQAHHPPGPDTPPAPNTTPPGSRLRHTVYERPVRILLECILVLFFF